MSMIMHNRLASDDVMWTLETRFASIKSDLVGRASMELKRLSTDFEPNFHPIAGTITYSIEYYKHHYPDSHDSRCDAYICLASVFLQRFFQLQFFHDADDPFNFLSLCAEWLCDDDQLSPLITDLISKVSYFKSRQPGLLPDTSYDVYLLPLLGQDKYAQQSGCESPIKRIKHSERNASDLCVEEWISTLREDKGLLETFTKWYLGTLYRLVPENVENKLLHEVLNRNYLTQLTVTYFKDIKQYENIEELSGVMKDHVSDLLMLVMDCVSSKEKDFVWLSSSRSGCLQLDRSDPKHHQFVLRYKP